MSEPPLDIRLPGHADRISAARMIDTTNPTIYLPFIFTPAKEKGFRSRPPPCAVRQRKSFLLYSHDWKIL